MFKYTKVKKKHTLKNVLRKCVHIGTSDLQVNKTRKLIMLSILD